MLHKKIICDHYLFNTFNHQGLCGVKQSTVLVLFYSGTGSYVQNQAGFELAI